MTDVSQHLQATARKVAAVYAAHPNARAVAVFGSLARGCTDEFSDIDMGVFYGGLPTEEEIAGGRERLAATEWRRFSPPEAEDMADSFRADGVECQVIHCRFSRMEEDLADVLERQNTEHEKHVVAGGIL